MILALENFRGRFSLAFEIDVIDVDQHPALEATWGDKVPVLLAAVNSSQEICHYLLDETALQRAMISEENSSIGAASQPL